MIGKFMETQEMLKS